MSLNIPDTFGVSKTPCSSWKLQALLWICYYYFWWYSILYLYLSIKIITCVGWVYHPVSIGGYSKKNPNWTSFSSAKKITVVLPFGISQVVVVGCNSIWICRKAAGKFREKHKKMGWKILVHQNSHIWKEIRFEIKDQYFWYLCEIFWGGRSQQWYEGWLICSYDLHVLRCWDEKEPPWISKIIRGIYTQTIHVWYIYIHLP